MLAQFGQLDASNSTASPRIARGKLPIDIMTACCPTAFFAPAARQRRLPTSSMSRRMWKACAGSRNARPGGRLVMTVPRCPVVEPPRRDVPSLRRYTRGGLSGTGAGWAEAGQISYFNTLLFPLIAGVRLIRKAIGFEGADDDAMPHPAANEILKRIFGFESHLVGRIPLPLGVSLLAVAERPL
jgi:hypothetical protein